MKNLIALGLICLVGCAVAKAEPKAGESAAAIALTYANFEKGGSPLPSPLPTAKCDGTGWITHGDGHRTQCPGCTACKPAQSAVEAIDLIQPAVYTRVTKVAKQQCADGSCTAGATECECTADGGACACSAPTRARSSGSCASGSCGGSSAQSARGPLRRVGGFFRERRPVRRFLGRLFGRR